MRLGTTHTMFRRIREKPGLEHHTNQRIQLVAYTSAVKCHLLKVMSENSWNKVGAILPYPEMVRGAYSAGSTSEEATFAIIVKLGLVMKPEEGTKQVALRAYLELERGGVNMSVVKMHLSPLIPELAHANVHLLQPLKTGS